jgi:hypothetical protein
VSLQGPEWPFCVRRVLSSGAHLRRPCILFFLAMTTSWPGTALAKCHIFKVWHYPKPQRCFTALAPLPAFHMKRISDRSEIPSETDAKPASRVPETSHERIEIAIPNMDFVPCPDGDERFQGIAKLHALIDAR